MASAHTALPDQATVAKAAALNVFDAEGNQLSFGSLFRDQKTIVVFIRTILFLRGA